MIRQNVLIVGSGGREHALAWKISQSPHLKKLYVAPGNGGTASIAENVDLKVTDLKGLADFAASHHIDLTVIGPDDVLAAGIVDAFAARGLRVLGPTKAAAQIEASKAFSKQLMIEAGVPTAKFATFSELQAAKHYVLDHPTPVVVKASGLALGKGVYVCTSHDEALKALDEIMGDRVFGEAGNSVVVEEFLEGQEVSIHAFCDGKTAVLFPTAQDHKRIGTGDTGPNTGGMGAFAPVPWTTDEFVSRVKTQVVEPILAELTRQGRPYKGILYPGIMVAPDDTFKVLEFNARFGDPETQSFLRLLETDLLDILNACVDGTLASIPIKWSSQTAVTVVLASEGYPAKSQTGRHVKGIRNHTLELLVESEPDIVVFHAGTGLVEDRLVTTGGRVFSVTATGSDLRDAQAKAYTAAKRVHFDGMQYRTDIGNKALGK